MPSTSRSESVREWFRNLPGANEKLTELRFYFHNVSGPSLTAIKVAEVNITRTSLTSFGMIRVLDNPLTMGPEPDSKIIGHARGIYGGVSFEIIDLLMKLNYVIAEGEYNRSMLSVLAHSPVRDRYQDMPIVGGTGVFRLARGIATARTTWFNFTTQDAVVEYNVMVLHYVSN